MLEGKQWGLGLLGACEQGHLPNVHMPHWWSEGLLSETQAGVLSTGPALVFTWLEHI